MTTQWARRVLFTLGLACGALLFFGFIAAVLILRANASGAESEWRQVLAARLAWVRNRGWRRSEQLFGKD